MSLGSVDYKKVYSLVVAYNETLRADDVRFFNTCVRLVTDDGRQSFFSENAFLMRYEDWWIVFAEHDQPKIFHADDVVYWSEYEKLHVGYDVYQKKGKEELK
jgi:hypothetical protein